MAFGGVEKARGIPAGVNTRDLTDIANALSGVLSRQRQGDMFATRPYPRPEQWSGNLFGPGSPFTPQGLDPARTDTGQPDPRIWEYPIAWNVQLNTTRPVSWETLAKWSEMPLFRSCIELRKTEISTLEWQFRVSPKAAAQIAQRTGQYSEDVARTLREKYQDTIDRVSAFWEVPDRKNGRNFAEWIALCMDEQLTHDALAIYPHLTYGGDLHGLWILDGSTIMPLFDETGGRPLPPAPAYQQILYGFPRGEFTAQVVEDANGNKVVPGGMQAGQLVYKRRVPRTKSPYGFGPTEQALLDGLLYTKRFQWMLAEYTEGTMPAQFMESDGMLDWTPMQLAEYERRFNDEYAGQTAQRMRFPFLPPGFHAAAMAQPGERYSPNFDLHLVKLVAMHFQTTITELGFTETGGLGSTGYHEGQEDIQFRKSRLPDLRWFGSLITEISRTHLGLPPEIEFTFLGLDDEDEAASDLVDQQRVASGRMTLNQAVTKLGFPAYGFKEADMPMLQTARGVVFIEGASETAPAGVMIEPASEIDSISGPLSGGKGGANPSGTKPAKVTPSQKNPGQAKGGLASKEAQAELAAYRRWVTKPGNRTRPFRCEHLTEELAKELAPDLDDAWTPYIEFAKAGGNPKDPGGDGSLTLSWSPYTPQR